MEYTPSELVEWAHNNKYDMDLMMMTINNHHNFAHLEIGNCKVLTKDGETVVKVPLCNNEFMYQAIDPECAWMMRSKKHRKYIVQIGNSYQLVVLEAETNATDYFAEQMLEYCGIRTRGKLVELFKDAYAIYKQTTGELDDYETFRESMLGTYADL